MSQLSPRTVSTRFRSMCEQRYIQSTVPVCDAESLKTFIAALGIDPRESVIASTLRHQRHSGSVLDMEICVACAWECEQEQRKRTIIGDDEEFLAEAWVSCGGAPDRQGTVAAASLVGHLAGFGVHLSFPSENSSTEDRQVGFPEFVAAAALDQELLELVACDNISAARQLALAKGYDEEHIQAMQSTIRAYRRLKRYLRQAKVRQAERRSRQVSSHTQPHGERRHSNATSPTFAQQPLAAPGVHSDLPPAPATHELDLEGKVHMLKAVVAMNRAARTKLPTRLPPMDLEVSHFKQQCAALDAQRREEARAARRKQLDNLHRTHPHSKSYNIVADYAKGVIEMWTPPALKRSSPVRQRIDREHRLPPLIRVRTSSRSPTRSIGVQTGAAA